MTGMLDGRVALVTGAASGIGRSTALAFAHNGARVVVADVVDDLGRETVDLIEAAGGEAIFVSTDVSQRAEVERLVKTAVDTFGGLHCAHNNAGIEGGAPPGRNSTRIQKRRGTSSSASTSKACGSACR